MLKTLEAPDVVERRNEGYEARKWLGRRAIIVRYEEHEDELHVYSISATRRRLAP